jgi:hypothetical protein
MVARGLSHRPQTAAAWRADLNRKRQQHQSVRAISTAACTTNNRGDRFWPAGRRTRKHAAVAAIHEKPITDRIEISAQLLSFNFPNNPIRTSSGSWRVRALPLLQ